MEITLLNDIIIIFALSLGVIYLFHKINVPPIIGFLLTGVIAGPYGLGLVKSVHEVELLAEIGILLLLFTIGIEFSFREITRLRKPVFLGGAVQTAGTIAVVILSAKFFGFGYREALFFGFLAALSSTAIVLKLYAEKGIINTPHGKSALSILIFQDIIVVVMMLVVPLLGGEGEDPGSQALFLILKAAGIVVFVIVAARYIIPVLFLQITRTRSRELFLISVFVLCFGIVWITSLAGLSLALGAFLAGLIISESEYNHQALGNILPFRDVFLSFFFVSIGMLLDIGFVISNFPVVIGLSLLLILGKSIIASAAVLSFRYPLRTAIITGISLGQVGEFSFVLAKTGSSYGLLPAEVYQYFLSVSVVTMAVTPFLISGAPAIAGKILQLPVLRRFGKGVPDSTEHSGLNDHLIIIGYGLNGRNLAHAARTAGIKYIVTEMNPDTVKNAKLMGEPIFYGDAANPEILVHAGIKKGRVLVVAINDASATQRVVSLAREMNPGIYIITRTRYLTEINTLQELGADEVIPEEFETSVEIFSRTLNKYLVPKNEINEFVEKIRSENYDIFRELPGSSEPFRKLKLNIPGLEAVSFYITPECDFAGKTLGESNFRNNFSATVAAVKREEEIILHPGQDYRLLPGDYIYVLTTHENVNKLNNFF